MVPHAASGGNSAIEDAACIAECLDWAVQSGIPISAATSAFETLRRPRVERMQSLSPEGYSFLGAADDFLPIRNEALAEQTRLYDEELALPEDVRRQKAQPEPDMNAPYATKPVYQWLFRYDAIAATRYVTIGYN